MQPGQNDPDTQMRAKKLNCTAVFSRFLTPLMTRKIVCGEFKRDDAGPVGESFLGEERERFQVFVRAHRPPRPIKRTA